MAGSSVGNGVIAIGSAGRVAGINRETRLRRCVWVLPSLRSFASPRCTRTLRMCELKAPESAISVRYHTGAWGQNGWKFEPCVRRDPDPFTVPSISTRSIVPMIRNHRDARRVGPLSAELRHIYRGKKKRSLRGSYCLAKKRQRSLTDDPWPGRTLCESQFNITHLKSLPPQPTVFLLRNSYLESVARVFI